MIIYSEKTKKTYPTIEACKEAEAAYDAKIAEQKRIAEEKEKAREAREVEIENAYEAMVQARKNYNDLVNAYNKDYMDCKVPCDCEKDECCDECCDEENEHRIELSPADILALLFTGLR